VWKKRYNTLGAIAFQPGDTAVNQRKKRKNYLSSKLLKRQLKVAFEWLSQNKWLATGSLSFVSMIYWYNFISFENIPINIVSSDFISSIPAIFSYLAFFIVLFGFYLFAPAVVFFTPVREKNGKYQYAMPRPKDFDAEKRKLFWRWMAIQSMIVLLAVFAGKYVDPPCSILALLSLFAITVFLAVFLLASMPADADVKKASIRCEFLGAVLFSVLLQAIIVFVIFVVIFEGEKQANSGVVYFSAFLWSIVLFLSQLAITKFVISASRHKDFIKKSIVGVFAVIFLLGFIPQTGSFLLGLILRNTTSGLRHCTVLSWDKSAAFGAVSPDVMGDVLGDSKPLRIFIEADGNYIVRTLEMIEEKSKTVHFIPKKLVLSMEKCQSSTQPSASKTAP